MFGMTRKVMQREAMYPSSFGWFAHAIRWAVPPEHWLGIPHCIRNDGFLDIICVHFFGASPKSSWQLGKGVTMASHCSGWG